MSDRWCTIFKKKWNLSTQKIKSSKLAVNIPSDEDINKFVS